MSDTPAQRIQRAIGTAEERVAFVDHLSDDTATSIADVIEARLIEEDRELDAAAERAAADLPFYVASFVRVLLG